MITVGVLGCGKIAERHILAYRKIPHVEISVADVNQRQAERLGAEFGLRVAQSPEEIYTSPAVEAIDICVPNVHHKGAVVKALHHGKHVFCEKPLCLNLDEATEIQALSKMADRIVMVGHLYRFHPAFTFVKETLEQGVIGRTHLAFFRLGGRGSHALWKHQSSQGGGAILEMLVHNLDLLFWYFGNIDTAECLHMDTVLKSREIAGRLREVDAEDFVLLKLQANGTLIICEGDMLTPSYMNTIEFHGENGSVLSSILHFLPTIVFCKTGKGVFNQGNNFYTFPQVNLFDQELRHFIHALENGGQHANAIDDSVKIFRVLEGLRKPA